MSTITFIEPLLPSVHDTLSLREALSKLARKSSKNKYKKKRFIYSNVQINLI
jgi:hypothetical protein